MASKIKVDTLETANGSGTIALSNQFSGMSTASLPTLTASEMPSGSVLQSIRFSPSTTTQISIGSSSTPSFTEFSSSYRLAITPKFANSTLRLTYTGLIGGRDSSSIMSFKFYDITNSSNVGVSTLGTGSSRTFCNASYRIRDGDNNDRHNIIMTAYQAASNTNARTYGVYGAMESNSTFDVNMTDVDNAGCSFVTPNFTIEEIAQ